MFRKSETDKLNMWVCLRKLKVKEAERSSAVDPGRADGWQTVKNMVNLDTEIVMYQ